MTKRILVADDDASVRELCRVVLQAEGYNVEEAEDAPTCISLARAQPPDLVLLDWMMPGVDGIDALRALKSGTGTRAVPVVMLTALDDVSQVTMATMNGADGYVTKPFDVDDLLTLVRRFTASPEAA
jgi:DNA-binding response OmpR family regulator